MPPRQVPELLAPAGSTEAARAAIANGADAVYLGVERFNARDEGAQLTMDELEQVCALAREHGVRIYLTLNTLLKPSELSDALLLLGAAIDRGIDAAIVQDLGLVRLIHRVYPGFEIHGSTQMTVHDELGAGILHDMGVQRVVMARENTLDDLRRIRGAVPELGVEVFIHGALCISYSGQCLMSGLISERSANRGSCAQACRKDYVLRDDATGDELDRGYLISAKDLAAHEVLPDLADLGIVSLKVEGRKKKPEYVAIVTQTYREMLTRVAQGKGAPSPDDITPLVQIYSRGFTTGMLRGRGGRGYVTREQPDNRGDELGVVVGREAGELIIEVRRPVAEGDGLGFEPPAGTTGQSLGFSVSRVRTLVARDGMHRQAIQTRTHVPAGWRVVRSSQLALLERARRSYERLPVKARPRPMGLDVRASGAIGSPLTVRFSHVGEAVEVQSTVSLQPAREHALDETKLREQLGRLGDTPFTLGSVDVTALDRAAFLPVRELNDLRRRAVETLLTRYDWAERGRLAVREASVREAVTSVAAASAGFSREKAHLVAEVFRADDARASAAAGANEIVFDPFLRHPVPPVSRIRALREELAAQGVTLRIRTPTIIRPSERELLDKWLALGTPVLSGHLGLACALASQGRDVAADYATNVFNGHTAAELFNRGVTRVTASVELTTDEMRELVAPWQGQGFEVVIYGRPEGMTLEHCVLSAAFNREPTTCRDLCVRDHPVVALTDPAGYTFPVATDSDCRNRLLHSRPIEASEFLPRLWRFGLRTFRVIFNVPGEPVAALVGAYRGALDSLGSPDHGPRHGPRSLVGTVFTRGHFAKAV